ncbi:Golgi transport complex subunit 4 [Phlyctochytrium planicorne]|nr:Golgi transport complex subunit 4 [Phlyctochytrium planicorne]
MLAGRKAKEELNDAPLQDEDQPKLEASLPLDKLRQLIDLDEIQNQLRILNEEENRLDLELDQILKTQGEAEKKLDSLEFVRPAILDLLDKSDKLYEVVDRTSELAESISRKVRQLDLEQSRVRSAYNLAQETQDLKDCALGVQQAIKDTDFETAGLHISRFLQFDHAMMDRIFESQAAMEASVIHSVPDQDHFIEDAALLLGVTDSNIDLAASGERVRAPSPMKVLRSAQKMLSDIVVEEFDKAVKIKDEETMIRFLKIFPLIGKKGVGLDRHSTYVCGIVARMCQDWMKELNEKGLHLTIFVLAQTQLAATGYADQLTQLFEFVANIIDAQETLINTHFGPGRLLRIIVRLQREADIQSSIILSTFSERKQISRRISEVSQQNTMFNIAKPAGKNDNQVDPREVDGIINEMAVISQRTDLFERFLKLRAEDQSAKAGVDASAEELKGILVNPSSNLSVRVRELMANYTTFEEYFIRRSIEKAMKIEEVDSVNNVSTSVDDVFYIIKKSVARSLATADPISICSLFNVVGRILETDFVNVYLKKLTSLFSSSESKEARTTSMILLNNIDVSCEYIQKLVKEVTNDIDVLFTGASQETRSNMKTTVISLADYSTSFKKILMTWVENLFTQTIKPRLRILIQDSYKDVKYNLTDEEYSEQDAQDLFVKRFLNSFKKVVALYQKTFTDRNYNQTIAHCIDSFVKDWERHILQNHKFNQLGGLRLDKDVRSITTQMTAMTKWAMREKFARLSQISILLNLDNLAEVTEVWGTKAGGVQWRLTAADAKRWLLLRVDFKPDDINTLAL